MVKIYSVVTARKQEEIEDKINQLAADGWEVNKFGSATAEWNRFWVLMVKEEQENIQTESSNFNLFLGET